MTKPKTLHVQPVEGRSLPLAKDPKRHLVGAREVPNTSYYRRALKRGDIALVTTSKKAKSKSKSDPKAENA